MTSDIRCREAKNVAITIWRPPNFAIVILGFNDEAIIGLQQPTNSRLLDWEAGFPLRYGNVGDWWACTSIFVNVCRVALRSSNWHKVIVSNDITDSSSYLYLVQCCCTNDSESQRLRCNVVAFHHTSWTETTAKTALLEWINHRTYSLHVVDLYCSCSTNYTNISLAYNFAHDILHSSLRFDMLFRLVKYLQYEGHWLCSTITVGSNFFPTTRVYTDIIFRAERSCYEIVHGNVLCN